MKHAFPWTVGLGGVAFAASMWGLGLSAARGEPLAGASPLGAGPGLGGALAEAVQRVAMVAPSAAALMAAEGAAGGRSQSANFRADWRVAGPLGPKAASPLYRAEFLALGPSLPLGPTPPFPVAVVPKGGAAQGSTPVTVLGLHFQTPGAGPLAAQFGATQVPLNATSNLVATAAAPSGVNAYGNPLGAVEVGVTSNLGAGLGAAEFVHYPALVLRAPVQVGAQLRLDLVAAPGSALGVFFGAPIPGVAVPVPPFLGAVELLSNVQALGGFTPLLSGSAQLSLPVPPLPGLAGFALHLQGLALDGAAGSFTNLLSTTILP